MQTSETDQKIASQDGVRRPVRTWLSALGSAVAVGRRVPAMIASCAFLLLAGMQTSAAAPVINSLNPATGSTAGGTFVTINGAEFGPEASDILSVVIGGVPVQSFELLTIAEPGTQIGVITPAREAGTVDVVIAFTGGRFATKIAGFTYVDPPALSGVSPASGLPAGGETLTIQGSSLATAFSVEFGTCTVDELFGPLCDPSTTAAIVSQTDTEIVITAPALAEATYDLLVSTQYGKTILPNAYTATSATAVSNVTISASPTTEGQSSTVQATFTSTTALSAGDTITVKLTGYSFPVGATTVITGAGFVAGTSLSGTVAGGATDTVVVTVGAGGTVAGSFATLGIPAINPAAGTLARAGLTVATSQDTIAVASGADIVITSAAGPATRLAFIQLPSGGGVTMPFTTQPQVAIQDASGVIVSNRTDMVTLTKASGTGEFTCNTNTVAAVAGVATFSGCRVNVVTGNLVISASAPGLTSATSSAISATATPPTLTLIESRSNTQLMEDQFAYDTVCGSTRPTFRPRITPQLVFELSNATDSLRLSASNNPAFAGSRGALVESPPAGSSDPATYRYVYLAPEPDRNGQVTLNFTAENPGGQAVVQVPLTVGALNDRPLAEFNNGGAGDPLHFRMSQADLGQPFTALNYLDRVLPGPDNATDEASQSVTVSVSLENPELPAYCSNSVPVIDAQSKNLQWTVPGEMADGGCAYSITLRDSEDEGAACPEALRTDSTSHGSCRRYTLTFAPPPTSVNTFNTELSYLRPPPPPCKAKGLESSALLSFRLSNRSNVYVSGTRLQLTAPRGITSPTWTCSSPSGGCTPAAGAGAVDTLIDFDVGQTAEIVYSGVYDGSLFVTTRYSVSPPNDLPPDTLIEDAPENVELNLTLSSSGLFYGSFEGR